MAQILVVDDDAAIRETLRLLLEDAGYDVVEAADGVAALDALRASIRPMVVLLDMMMPRMNGSQVLAVVAGDERLSATHAFITVTASPRARALAAEARGARLVVPCVEKPFDIDALLEVVERAIGRLPRPFLANGAVAGDAIPDSVVTGR